MKLPSIYTHCIKHVKAELYRAQLEKFVPKFIPWANQGDLDTTTTFYVKTKMTLQQIEDVVINKYAKFMKDHGNETALHVANFNPNQQNNKPGAKHCYYCGKDGHNEWKCCKKKNDYGNMQCTYCGSTNHTVNWCFQLHPHLRNQGGNPYTNGRQGNCENNNNFNNRPTW